MMLSAEVRWFWRGAPPEEFARWFAARRGGPLGEPDVRRDEYLKAPQTELGIKRRAGRGVEVKGLIARKPVILRFGSLESPIEIWGKWSEALDLACMQLVPVTKQRWLRRFAVTGSNVRELTSADGAQHDNAYNVELTHVTAPDQSKWWTLGFESQGSLDAIEATLQAVVHAMAAGAPPSLGEAIPENYPAWLSRQGWLNS